MVPLSSVDWAGQTYPSLGVSEDRLLLGKREDFSAGTRPSGNRSPRSGAGLHVLRFRGDWPQSRSWNRHLYVGGRFGTDIGVLGLVEVEQSWTCRRLRRRGNRRASG